MITRSAIGWQTMLADLSLILFMVTAAAMADPPAKPAPKPAPKPAAMAKPAPPPPPAALANPVQGQPLALWREAPGGVGLGTWLASQQIDSRQQLTITLRYPAGEQTQALINAARLMGEAQKTGHPARLVMEPAGEGVHDVLASLAYDRPVQP